MYDTTLADQYLTKLKEYLEAQLISNPPQSISNGHVQVGKYQASPEAYTYVVTLHEGDPKDTSRSGKKEWRHEVNDDYPMEMPGCSATWNYRYTCHIQFYMTISGEDQTTALTRGRVITNWFRQRINEATPSVLGLTTSDFGEFAYHQYVKASETLEGGGPTGSYIEKSVLFIEQLVYVPGV